MDYYHIDSFTSTLFSGNPAGVVILHAFPADDVMRHIAAENKHAETAFIVQRNDGDFNLRWFTPTVEVPLCGHATLAAAYALRLRGHIPDAIRFHTQSGVLTVRGTADALQMDFPQYVPQRAKAPTGSLAALGVRPLEIWNAHDDWWLLLLESESAVRDVNPDFRTLEKIDAFGYIVTAPAADSNTDFVYRFFAPRVGIDEDPVTGGVQSALAPFWAARLQKPHLIARQISARGGTMTCTLEGDRVKIAGQARLYLKGRIDL